VAAPEVGGREGRHEELLRLPVVRGARLDLATGHRRQLARFRLHHLVLRDVLDRLSERGPGPLDGDCALVVDGGPDVDRLAGHVAAAVQSDPAGHRPCRHAGHAQLVLDLAVERLREDAWLLVEVDGVHDNEDLLVLVAEAAGLLQGGLAVVLNPAVLAEEGGGQADGESQLEGEGVDPWGQQDRYSSYIWLS